MINFLTRIYRLVHSKKLTTFIFNRASFQSNTLSQTFSVYSKAITTMTFSTVNFGQMLLATFALSVISMNAGRIAGKPAHHDLGDAIETKVSNVAPFRNPTEKYKYDYLPWPCASHGHVEGGMGGFLIGERLRASSYQVYFLSQTEKQSLCGVKTLTVEQTTVCVMFMYILCVI